MSDITLYDAKLAEIENRIKLHDTNNKVQVG